MSWIKNHKILTIAIALILIIAVTLAIVLPLTLKSPDNRVVYDVVKQTKADNYKLLNEAKFTKHGQIVLIGDSITEIYNVELFNSFTEITHLTVYNRGIIGDFSAKLLERLESNALNIEPAYMSILIGTNDLEVGVKIEDTVANIAAMLDKTRKVSPATKIIVQAVYPVNRSMKGSAAETRTNKKIDELNAAIEQMIVGKAMQNVTFVNFNAWLRDEKGEFNAEYTYDGLHPNAAGYMLITSALIKYFGYSEN